MPRKIIIAVTPGDPAGIGPEIVWKSLRQFHRNRRDVALLCVGAKAPFLKLGAPVIEIHPGELKKGMQPPARKGPFVWLLPAPNRAPSGRHLAGYQSGWSIEKATDLVQSGVAAAITTGPISKERLQKGGFPYPGHTEFLAALCGRRGDRLRRSASSPPDVTMMLANDQLRVTLVTTHLGLSQVPRALTRAALRRTILHTADHLRKWWGLKRPKIAVAALNPHAGESGLFGQEEIRVIDPEIRALRRQNRGQYQLFGPVPADTLFAKNSMAKPGERYDAVVCMYHDQGLIPVKLLDFPRTVNVSLGLPIVRTSVDHGVGFDIAGKNVANPSSFQSAIDLALQIVHQLQRGKK